MKSDDGESRNYTILMETNILKILLIIYTIVE